MKFEDLLSGTPANEILAKHLVNGHHLHAVLNELEAATGQFFKVTSGFRSWEKHKEIYRAKNDLRLIQGKSELPIPLHSKHLTFEAADLADPTGDLRAWLAAHESFMVDYALYQEDPAYTPGWTHLQISPPASGRRVFKPF